MKTSKQQLFLKKLLSVTSAVACFSLLAPLSASAATMVNQKLVLAVDVSNSVDDSEFILQRDGYVNAFNGGLDFTGTNFAVTFLYWSTGQQQVVDADLNTAGNQFFHITDNASAALFANAIANVGRTERANTNTAGAINFSQSLIENDLDFMATEKIIDISSDGKQNTLLDGTSVPNCNTDPALCFSITQAERDQAEAAGIIINGLPILNDFPDLNTYFIDNVITLNGFTQIANDFNDFGESIQTKIARETGARVVFVPEPSSLLGLFTLTSLGIGSFLVRKKGLEKGDRL
jgi:hypothetical protein